MREGIPYDLDDTSENFPIYNEQFILPPQFGNIGSFSDSVPLFKLNESDERIVSDPTYVFARYHLPMINTYMNITRNHLNLLSTVLEEVEKQKFAEQLN